MTPLAILFALFALFGLLCAVAGHAAKRTAPAPSMVTNNVSPAGYTVFIVCGLLALAAWAGH